jgi:hypothetical protein
VQTIVVRGNGRRPRAIGLGAMSSDGSPLF